MLSHYLNVLDTLKEHQVSEILRLIREQMQLVIQSEYTSSGLKAFFNSEETASLMIVAAPITMEALPAKLNAAYVMGSDKKLYYFNRKKALLQALPLSDADSLSLMKRFKLSDEHFNLNENELKNGKVVVETLSAKQLDGLSTLSGHRHLNAVPLTLPYTYFAHEPKQISQIKEILNGIYHAQLAFKDLEMVDLRSPTSWPKDLYTLYFHTMTEGCKASSLIKLMDLETGPFSGYITLLTDLFAAIKGCADGDQQQLKTLLSQVHPELLPTIKTGLSQVHPELLPAAKQSLDGHFAPLIKTAVDLEHSAIKVGGKVAGIALDQMQLNPEKINFNVVANICTAVPTYIDKLTTIIKQYSDTLDDVAPEINKDKVKEMENLAFTLLYAINSIRDNDVVLSVKMINYIHLLQNLITLSTTTLSEMGNLNEATQETVLAKLKKIKYELLPEILSLTDAFEVEAYLVPGLLSKPLAKSIEPFYQRLVNYVSGPVKFKKTNRDLLTLHDKEFVASRTAKNQQRINQAKQNLSELNQVEKAFHQFFKILEEHQGKNLHHLSPSIKNVLLQHYSLLQPYFAAVDIKINNEIIVALTSAEDISKLRKLYEWAKGTHGNVKATKLLTYKSRILNELSSAIATETFEIDRHEAVIAQINTQYPQALLSVVPDHNHPFYFNETEALNLDNKRQADLRVKTTANAIILTERSTLSTNERFALAHYYAHENKKLIEAAKAYDTFLSLLTDVMDEPLHTLDQEKRAALLQSYAVFQPYAMFLTHNDTKWLHFHSNVVLSLQGKKPASEIKGSHFAKLKKRFDVAFKEAQPYAEKKASVYTKMAQLSYAKEATQNLLTPNEKYGKRARHFIKNKQYTDRLAKLKNKAVGLLDVFSEPMRVQLQAALAKESDLSLLSWAGLKQQLNAVMPNGSLPFPDVKNPVQSKKIIGIKELINGIHHLELLFKEFEKLSDDEYQTQQVIHLINICAQLNKIYGVAKNLYEDPHFRLIGKELQEKIMSLKEMVSDKRETYFAGPSSADHISGHVKYPPLWYAMQAFMAVPEEIHALQQNTPLTTADKEYIKERTKKVVIKIERIMGKSNSYFKLMFELPTMYSLFRELRKKLMLFTDTTFEAAMANLKEINTEVFAKILAEADDYEAKLGLKPGLLSGPLKAILDEFYQAMLEPLQLNSADFIAYVTDMSVVQKRRVLNQQRKTEAQQEQVVVAGKIDALKQLSHAIKKYQNFSKPGFSSPMMIQLNLVEQSRVNVLECYQRAKVMLIATPPQEEGVNPAAEVQAVDMQEVQPAEEAVKPIVDELDLKLQKAMRGIVDPNSSLIEIMSLVSLVNEKISQYQLAEKDEIILSNQQALETFVAAVKVYKNFSTPPLMALPLIDDSRQKMLASYEAIQAIFVSADDVIVDDVEAPKEAPVDLQSAMLLIDETANTDWEKWLSLVPFIEKELNKQQSMLADAQLDEAIATEKESYLTKLEVESSVVNQAFIQNYTNGLFDAHIKTLIKQQNEIIYNREEFNELMEAYLLTVRNEIVTVALTVKDVKTAVEEQLNARKEAFHQLYKKDFIQLETVAAAVNEFKNYIKKSHNDVKNNKSLLFEDIDTIRAKTACLNALTVIIANRDQTVEKRINLLRDEMKKTEVRDTLLAYRSLNVVSFNWLKRCIVNILHALNIFIPSYAKKFQILEEKVAKATHHYTFFKAPADASSEKTKQNDVSNNDANNVNPEDNIKPDDEDIAPEEDMPLYPTL